MENGRTRKQHTPTATTTRNGNKTGRAVKSIYGNNRKSNTKKVRTGQSAPAKSASAKRNPRTSNKRKSYTRKKKDTENIIHLSAWIALGIVAVLSLCVLLSRPHFVKSENGDKIPVRGYKFAIDLSHHNTGEIVWDSLRVMIDKNGYSTKSINSAVDIYPVSYVILKATEGNNLKDKKFKKNWANADAAGYRRGAYHFFRTSKKPETQAENFIKTVGHLEDKDLPPILDIETIHKGYPISKLNDSVKRWLDIIEKHYGRKPIIYSSESFIKDILNEEIRSSYPLWVAHYREKQPDRKDWAMWQFTDKAVVYGIEGNVDLNAIQPNALK